MYKLILAATIIICLSCKKDPAPGAGHPSAKELLTQRPWLLSGFGFDGNGNNRIDPAEESSEECQRDNKWHYFPDGTGLFEENTLTCGTGIERQPFTWKLIENDKVIDLFHDSLGILRLNEQEMLLYKELDYSNGEKVKLILVYRH